jgi:hypothetical protein
MKDVRLISSLRTAELFPYLLRARLSEEFRFRNKYREYLV